MKVLDTPAAEPTAPAKPPFPESPTPTGGAEQVARVKALRDQLESGQGPLAGALETAPDPTEVVPELFEKVVVTEDLPDSQPGDPADSYRDSQGRLRDKSTKQFLPEPTDEDRAARAQSTKAVADALGIEPVEGGEPAAEADDSALVFEFARDGRDPIKLAVEDQATLDTLRHLKNGFMKGEEVRKAKAEIDGGKAELDAIGKALETDPTGYLLNQIATEAHPDIAIALIRELPEEAYNRVIETLRAWEDDPITRREQALDAREARTRQRDELTKTTRAQQAQAETISQIGDAIEAMIPAGTPDADADDFYDMSLFKLRGWVVQNGRLPTAIEVPVLLEQSGVPKRFFNGTAAAKPTGSRPATPATPARPRAAADEGAIKRARTLPEELRQKTATRKAAAAIAPGGQGAGTGREPLFTPGENIRDRIKSARQALLGR